jgi:ribonuclease HII|tara:strand:+ start:965 stop:1552 length:588 start_codon:yes stop_codon:yes gene_type:complete
MIEDKIWLENPNKFIVGADEVGRGSFAGPICAAAVKINYSHLELLTNVKDSKKLSAKKREEIFSIVQKNNIQYSFKEASNTFIDQFGIKNANEKVLSDSISDIYTGNEAVYVDHFKINDFKAISVVRGEDNCKAIALASIIAKVLRDNLMIKFSEKYPEYSFEKNKGYGTKDHRKAISKYGLSNIHRKSFSLKPI